MSSSDQGSTHSHHSPKRMNPNRGRKKEPPLIPINPLVQPRGLPIQVPKGLSVAPMPLNISIFKGTRDEDLLAHIEYFIETLTTCLTMDGYYYLVWFPTTLKGRAYEWYCNHSPNIFLSWNMIQRTFSE